MADGVNSGFGGDSGEDVPNNFFDDFDKDDFMDGLRVIDSLNEKDAGESRRHRQSDSPSRMNNYANPCSQRRDLEKTNAAIRRDKEAKVKEHLAKHLESQDNIRPPGTELDDFFDKVRPSKIKKLSSEREGEPETRSPKPKKQRDKDSPRRQSPTRYRRYEDCDDNSGRGMRKVYPTSRNHTHSSNYGDRHYNPKYSPDRNPRPLNKYAWHRQPYHRHSPQHNSRHGSHHSPRNSPRYSPPRRSRHSPHHNYRRSPTWHTHHSPRRSPLRNSRGSRQSPSRSSRKWSKDRSYSKQGAERDHSHERNIHWSPTRSPTYRSTQNSYYNVQDGSQQFIQQHYNPEMSNMNAPYMYPPTGDFDNYLVPSGQPAIPMMPQGQTNMIVNQMGLPDMSMSQPAEQVMQMPQPVPMPINSVPPVMMDPNIPQQNFLASEVPMVPHPSTVTPASTPQPLYGQNVKASYEALVQLVAEGKLSHEDFLKLAPNTKGSNSCLGDKTKKVMSRCNFAVQKLSKLQKPNRLVLKKDECSTETLSLSQKYCSPLKRQVPIDFEITSAIQKNMHNKLLINSIVASINLENSILGTSVTKDNMKSVGVQTTTPYCDMCEIRDSVQNCDMSTSTNSEYFSSSVHTQVVEEDLLNSKAVFNPSGSIGDGGPVSIAHLTPAQLVSQLAARAKSFQQSDTTSSSQQFRRWNPSDDYDGRGGGHHFNQNNRYRY